MLRTVRVNPQTSTKDLQHDLAADGVTVHRSTIWRTLHKEMLYRRKRKPFLRPHHKQSCLRAVHARKPTNLNQLEMFCKEDWSKIPSATIQTLIRSYKKHVEAVISAKGGSTKY
ncbi:hypothetical protein NFI96_023332 [Prochilodus magdalenae]|nr:hypothetical protein NFI96_023332 [Prochilodus magdalenae]